MGVETTRFSAFDKSPASFNIHGTVLKARPDIACTMHLHTDAGAALSTMADGLMFLSQYAMRFWNKVSYHTYEGLVHGDDLAECETMTRNLGRNFVLIMYNHGTMVCGRSVGEAFLLMQSERVVHLDADAVVLEVLNERLAVCCGNADHILIEDVPAMLSVPVASLVIAVPLRVVLTVTAPELVLTPAPLKLSVA